MRIKSASAQSSDISDARPHFVFVSDSDVAHPFDDLVRELLEGERRSVVVRVANYKAGLVRAAAFVTSESAGRQWSGICPVVQNRRQVPSAQPA